MASELASERQCRLGSITSDATSCSDTTFCSDVASCPSVSAYSTDTTPFTSINSCETTFLLPPGEYGCCYSSSSRIPAENPRWASRAHPQVSAGQPTAEHLAPRAGHTLTSTQTPPKPTIIQTPPKPHPNANPLHPHSPHPTRAGHGGWCGLSWPP